MAKVEINHTPPVEPKIESVTITLSYEEAKELIAVLFSGIPADVLPDLRESLTSKLGYWCYRYTRPMNFGLYTDREKNRKIHRG